MYNLIIPNIFKVMIKISKLITIMTTELPNGKECLNSKYNNFFFGVGWWECF